MSVTADQPVLTPSTVTAGKEEVVIVEFPRELPRGVLVTLNFYYSTNGKKVATVPTVSLGPHTVKAKFPEFKPGEVDVIIHLSREESNLFPKFKIHVQSPLEAIFNSAPTSQGSNQIALLASVIAYLTHSDEKNKEMCAQADVILCEILRKIHTVELNDWCLGSFLAGKQGLEETLLHFCTRRRMDGMAEHLLLSKPNSMKEEYLSRQSSDNKTPIELAHKNEMKRVAEMAEKLMTNPGNRKSSTPKAKKKKTGVERAKSMDSNINHLCIPGNQDVTTLNQSQTLGSKKKGGKAAKMLRHFKKDKGLVVSNPQQPYVNEFGEAMVAPTSGMHSPTSSLPMSRSMEPMDQAATWSVHNRDESNNYNLAGSYGSSSPLQQPSSPLLMARRNFDELLVSGDSSRVAMTFPRSGRPESIASSSYSFDQVDHRFLHVDQVRKRPVSSSLSSGYGSALSNAIKELKTKALYLAEVVKEYNWTSVSQGDFDCILKVEDKVFVTQEGAEGDSKMCLGIWNGRYGKLPLDILKRLPPAEMQRLKDELDHESDYEEIDVGQQEEEDEDLYKVPRNVPRPVFSESESDNDDQPIYDVPPNKHNYLVTEDHSVDPRPVFSESESDNDDQPIYDVPPNKHNYLVTEDHSDDDYQNVPRGGFPPDFLGSYSHESGLHNFGNLRKGSVDHLSDDDKFTSSQPHNVDKQTTLSAKQPSVTVTNTHAKGVDTQKKNPLLKKAPILEKIRDSPKSEHKQFGDTSGYFSTEHIYDDLDSALSGAPIPVAIADQPVYDDTMVIQTRTEPVGQEPSEEYDEIIPVTEKKVTQSEAQNKTIPFQAKHETTVNGDVYTLATKKKQDDKIKPNKSSTPESRAYSEIMVVKNAISVNGEEMRVGRQGGERVVNGSGKLYKKQNSVTGNDEVFSKPPESTTSPNPRPKKRSRLPTTPQTKISPKPKPRRATVPTKHEDEETSPVLRMKQIIASSVEKGEVKTTVDPQTENKEQTRPSYVNIELRTRNKKIPPSPPRKHSSHSSSSPATVKKVQPPVAPKPKKPHT